MTMTNKAKFNRVEDYYITAVKFFALPPMARYIIGTTFLIAKWEEFVLNEDEISDMIFLRVIEKKLYPEFRQIVRNYRSIDVFTSK